MSSALKAFANIQLSMLLLLFALLANCASSAIADESEEGRENESPAFVIDTAADASDSTSGKSASISVTLSSTSESDIDLTCVFHDTKRGYGYLDRLTLAAQAQGQQTTASDFAFDTAYEVFAVPTADIQTALANHGLEPDSTVAPSALLDEINDKSNVATVTTIPANVKTISSVSTVPNFTTAKLIWNGTAGGLITEYRVYNGASLVGSVTSDVSGRDIRSLTVNYSYGKKNQAFSVCPVFTSTDFAGTAITYEGASANAKKFNGKKLQAGTISVTKISKNRVSIKANTDATGMVLYAKSNGSWKRIKTIAASGIVTYKKKNASKMSYRAKAYLTVGSKTYLASSYSKSANAQDNILSTGASTSVKRYKSSKSLFKVARLYYKNGKLRIDGAFINTYSRKLKSSKFKVTVYNGNKKIGSRTVNSKAMKKKSSKKASFYLKNSKKRIDLLNGDITISIVLKNMR